MLEIDGTPEVDDFSFDEICESENELTEVPSEQKIIHRIN